MREKELYDDIGEWLIENKGCQKNDYFQGYTKEPSVEGRERTRRPDVVGIRYEETDNKTPSFAFDYYFVEVKSQPTPGDLNELSGQMETLKSLVEKPEVEVAARNAEYYIAFENEVPDSARELAKENGYGILRVETDGDEIVNVRKRRSAETFDAGKGTVVSNNSQRSRGNFRKEVNGGKDIPQDKGTLILKHVMTDSEEFFEKEMRPLLEENKERRRRESFLDGDDSGMLDEIVGSLEERDGVELEFKKGHINVDVDDGEDWRIKIMETRFKVFDAEGDLLFRVVDDGEMTVFDKGLESPEDADDILSIVEDRLL